MNVTQALKKRFSTRAFLDKAVEAEIINAILTAAGHAPSGVNAQPWQVAVVTGEKKQEISQAIEKEFRSGTRGKMDYNYYPTEWIDPYKARRKACGLLMYSTLDIQREDKQKQQDQWAANYRAFDAPVMLFFFLDKVMEAGSYIDYGMFLQSIMLASLDHNLATCPQAALAEYPTIVKKALGYPDDTVLLCGMALGHPDPKAKVNNYRTPREAVETFTKYFE